MNELEEENKDEQKIWMSADVLNFSILLDNLPFSNRYAWLFSTGSSNSFVPLINDPR